MSAADVADIMAYVQNPPGQAPVDTTAGNECLTYDEIYPEDKSSSATLWFIILVVLFIIIAASASSVKQSLTNAHRESQGKEALPPMTYGQSFKAGLEELGSCVAHRFVRCSIRCSSGLSSSNGRRYLPSLRARATHQILAQHSRV